MSEPLTAHAKAVNILSRSVKGAGKRRVLRVFFRFGLLCGPVAVVKFEVEP
jgi:hypothetical protein